MSIDVIQSITPEVDDLLAYEIEEDKPDFDPVLSDELDQLDLNWEFVAQELGCSSVTGHTASCTTSNNCSC